MSLTIAIASSRTVEVFGNLEVEKAEDCDGSVTKERQEENEKENEKENGERELEKNEDFGKVSDGDDSDQPSEATPRVDESEDKKGKRRVLTEKQMEAEKLKLHSESQRMMRSGSLSLVKQKSCKSKASFSDFVKRDSHIGRQLSAPTIVKPKFQPPEPVPVDAPVSKASAAARLKAQKLERLLGRPLPELKSKSVAPVSQNSGSVNSGNGNGLRMPDERDEKKEIVLVKSAKDIQMDKLMQRFSQHSQIRKQKPEKESSAKKGSGGVVGLAASAVDEKVLTQMMADTLEEAKKNSAILAAKHNHQQQSKSLAGGAVDTGVKPVKGVGVTGGELAPGRGRHLLKESLKLCMLEKKREKHEVRCEMYEQMVRDYKERMGIEDDDAEQNKEESDEDFEPEQDGEEASDDAGEGDSGSDLGSDVNNGEDDEDDDEEEEKRERNLLIEDEAEEDNEDEDDSSLKRERTKEVRVAKRSADYEASRFTGLPLFDQSSERDVSGVTNAMTMNENTEISEASSYFPLAQAQRSLSSIHTDNTNTNSTPLNQSVLDDTMFPPVLYRSDSDKNCREVKEFLFNQSSLFDEDGMIRTERDSQNDKCEKERDDWIKCLLDSSIVTGSSESRMCPIDQPDVSGTCDQELESIYQQGRDRTVSSVIRGASPLLTPAADDNAIVDPEDIVLLCSGQFQTQNQQLSSDDAPSQKILSTRPREKKDVNVAKETHWDSMSQPNSLEDLEMLCSQSFSGALATQPDKSARNSQPQSNSRFQSSPLDDSLIGSQTRQRATEGRLESPMGEVEINSPIPNSSKLPPHAEYSPIEKHSDLEKDIDARADRKQEDIDDDGEDVLGTLMKKKNKTVDKWKRKSKAVLSDSDSDEDNTHPGLQLGGSLIEDEKDANGALDVNSVKLFSEGNVSDDKHTTKSVCSVDNEDVKVSEDLRDDEEGKAGRSLRRVVLEDDDDSGEEDDADDEEGFEDEEAADVDEIDDGFDDEGEDVEMDEDGNPIERVNEELLEYRRAAAPLNPKDFMDEEAELSGSDAGEGASDDEGDYGGLNPNEYEQEGLDDALSVSEAQLRDENGRIHLADMLSEEQRDLKLLTEFLIGDEEEDGMQRIKLFSWSNMDENDLGSLFHKDEDSDDDDASSDLLAKTDFVGSMAAALGVVHDISEQAGSMAKARLEMRQWLQSQQAAAQLQNMHEKQLQQSQFNDVASFDLDKVKFTNTQRRVAASVGENTDQEKNRAAENQTSTAVNTSEVGLFTTKKALSGSGKAGTAGSSAEWSGKAIDHYFKSTIPTNHNSSALYRHTSLLKRATENLTMLAERMREKSKKTNSSASANSVMQATVDTRNMVFRPREQQTTNSASAPSDQHSTNLSTSKSTPQNGAKNYGVKRKSTGDAIGMGGCGKRTKLDLNRTSSMLLSFLD